MKKKHPQPSTRLPRVRSQEAGEGAGRAGASGWDARVQGRAILLHTFRTRDGWWMDGRRGGRGKRGPQRSERSLPAV